MQLLAELPVLGAALFRGYRHLRGSKTLSEIWYIAATSTVLKRFCILAPSLNATSQNNCQVASDQETWAATGVKRYNE